MSGGGRRKKQRCVKEVLDIGLFTELKNKKEDRVTLPGFEGITVNRYNKGKGGAGGVAILTKRGIKRQHLNLKHCKKDFDICSIRLFGEAGILNVLCVYRRLGAQTRTGAWTDIFRNIDTNEPTIIGGDFNAHHVG